ncbi:hypothetical protein D3C81_1392710 [compost metagenome]
MEDIHTRFGQRLQERAQRLGTLHQTSAVILLLPLREAEDDRKVRADRSAHSLDQLNGKTRTSGQIATVFVSTLVAGRPEELIDQVTVGTVDLHPIHTDRLSIAGGLGESFDHLTNIVAAHAVDRHLAILDLLAGTIARHAGVRLGTQAAHAANMPELRNDATAFGMHGINDLFPAGQGVFAMEARYVRIAVGGLVIDCGAFGDDQADTCGGTATVVLDDLGMRYTAGAEGPGHRCHDHTAWQL